MGVGRRCAPPAEPYAQGLPSLLNGSGRRVGRDYPPCRHALGRRLGTQQERREMELKLVFLGQPLDLNEADVAPGSNEVGDQDD